MISATNWNDLSFGLVSEEEPVPVMVWRCRLPKNGAGHLVSSNIVGELFSESCTAKYDGRHAI